MTHSPWKMVSHSNWFEQLRLTILGDGFGDILILGAPGMAKSHTLREALADVDVAQPVRIVCSASQQHQRLAVLSPYMSEALSEDTSVIAAMKDVASLLCKHGVAQLVIVEEGHYLDTTSAYVLKMLSSLGKIRLVVVSTDLDQSSALNELLLSTTATTLMIVEPYTLEQLHGYLSEKLGISVTTGFLRTVFRLSGGIPEILDAVLAQIVATQPPPEHGPWALQHPLPSAGLAYRAQLDDLVSRLDPNLVAIYGRFAYNRKLTIDEAKNVAPQGLPEMISGGYLALSGGQVSARSAALAKYIAASQAQPEQLARVNGQQLSMDPILESERILGSGYTEYLGGQPWSVIPGAAGRLLRAAAQEMGAESELSPKDLDNELADLLAGSEAAEFEALGQTLATQTDSFANMDLQACHAATTSIREFEQRFPRRWYPRIPRLIADLITTLQLGGPAEARQALEHFENTTPSTWFERNNGYFALCHALLENIAGNFKVAWEWACEAEAEFLCQDPNGLYDVSVALRQSLSMHTEAETIVFEDSLDRFSHTEINASASTLLSLRLHLLPLIIANRRLVTGEHVKSNLGHFAKNVKTPWNRVSRLADRILDFYELDRDLPESEEGQQESEIYRANLMRVLDHRAPLQEQVTEVERLYALGFRFPAYLLARGVLTKLERSGEPEKSFRLNKICSQIHSELKAAGLGSFTGNNSAREVLTDREFEVLSLAKAGVSNREIADQLFVSVRTVEGHIYRAFRKLEITAREDLSEISL